MASIIDSAGDGRPEIEYKIHKANATFHCYIKFLKSKNASKGTKMKIYSVMIRQTDDTAETMTMTQADINAMLRFEPIVLISILETVRKNDNQ